MDGRGCQCVADDAVRGSTTLQGDASYVLT